MPRKEDIITVRIPARDREAMQRIVDQGGFNNRSDFLRHAVRAAIQEHDRDGASARVELDFEEEGYEIPKDTETGLSPRRTGGRRRMSQ